MKRLRQTQTHLLAAILAVSVLLGSIPLVSGFTIVRSSTQTTFSVDVCQPLQPAATISGNPLARPAPTLPHPGLLAIAITPIAVRKPLADLHIAPDSPPPEAQS
jgi:hypothetical protein